MTLPKVKPRAESRPEGQPSVVNGCSTMASYIGHKIPFQRKKNCEDPTNTS